MKNKVYLKPYFEGSLNGTGFTVTVLANLNSYLFNNLPFYTLLIVTMMFL